MALLLDYPHLPWTFSNLPADGIERGKRKCDFAYPEQVLDYSNLRWGLRTLLPHSEERTKDAVGMGDSAAKAKTMFAVRIARWCI
jgi:hypothetical protein